MDSQGKTNTVGGTRGSFIKIGKGNQNFTKANVHSGATTHNPNPGFGIGGTVDSFVLDGEGDQSFAEAEIRSGVRVVKEEIKEVGINELWAHLEEIGVEEDSVSTAYMYLSKNPDALKFFNGVPIPKRKKMLPKIVLSKESDRNVKIT